MSGYIQIQVPMLCLLCGFYGHMQSDCSSCCNICGGDKDRDGACLGKGCDRTAAKCLDGCDHKYNSFDCAFSRHSPENIPSSNIGFICKEHAPKAGKFSGQDPGQFLGKIVKLGFKTRDEKNTEFMWVKVDFLGTHGTELEGTLDNDPVLDVGYVCGDGVGFDVSDIIEVYI